MPKINRSFLWEGFAFASGIPLCTWRAGFDHKVAVVQPDENQFRYRGGPQARIEARVKEVGLKAKSECVASAKRMAAFRR